MVLAQSDIVSVHVLLNAETRGLLNARRFGLMKQGAFVINTSRGPVINEPDLIEALRSGHLGGAGLDVFEHEPVAADSPLLSMPNVTLAPNGAGFAKAARCMGGLYRNPLTPQLKELTCPVMMIVGDRDFIGPGGSVILHRNIPGSRLEIVKDRGHGIYLEDPDGFNTLLLDFLKPDNPMGC